MGKGTLDELARFLVVLPIPSDKMTFKVIPSDYYTLGAHAAESTERHFDPMLGAMGPLEPAFEKTFKKGVRRIRAQLHPACDTWCTHV